MNLVRAFSAAALAVALSFGLSACGTVGAVLNGIGAVAGFTVTQNEISRAESAYVAVEGFFTSYRCLYDNVPADPRACIDNSTGRKVVSNPCRAGTHATITNICAERAIVVRLQATAQIVSDAFDRIQADFNDCQRVPAANQSAAPVCTGLGAAFKTLTASIDAATALARQFGFKG